MSDGAGKEQTLWLSTDGDNRYLIPDDVELAEGDLELRTLLGVERSVDADAVAGFLATQDEVNEHFRDQAQRRLAPVKEALSGILSEVGSAWRNAMQGAGDEAGDGAGSERPAGPRDGPSRHGDGDAGPPPDNVVPLNPPTSPQRTTLNLAESIAAIFGQNMDRDDESAREERAEVVALDEYGPLRRVALRHARDAFASQEQIDASWRDLGYRGAPDRDRAIAEYDGFVATLQQAGAEVEFLPGSEKLTIDAIYVRDASVMTPAGLACARMGKDARSGEPELAEATYRELGLSSGASVAVGCLEGGDMIWLDSRTCAVGEGYRSDPEGIARLQSLLPRDVDLVVCPLPHHRGPGDVFHLMSIVSPLDRDLALVHSPLMAVRFRRFLCDRGIELLEVPDSEFDALGCNVLALGPRRCLMLDGLPETRRVLESAGCEVLVYAGEEISGKGQGGPTCLTRPLQRG